MSKKGQNTQKGIFAQNWAALSLFLQFLRDKDFSYIQIEPDHSEDFDLVFSSGKKVICESKYRLEKFSYSQLKELLEKITARGSIDSRDEILVVCKNVSENLISLTKYIRYSAFREQEKAKLIKLGFNDQLLNLVSQVNFWQLEKVEDNELNYSLVAELINFWVPEDDIKRFTNDILQTKISQKATAGAAYSRSDLKKWDDLWQLNRVYYFTFGIFHVFEANLQTDKNRKYILSYIKKYTKTIRGFYRSDFFDVDVVKIVTKIIEGTDGTKYFNDAFAIIKDLITFNEKEFFYLKDSGYDRGEWEKGEICKLLHKVYARADVALKQKIFDLLVFGFNVTEDDGEFIHHAPTDVYGILREWLDEDFRGRFNRIVKLASNQYQRYYKKFGSKVEFKGWEHMGGGTSFGPGGHH